jgi:hypothetical protein
MKAEAFLEKYGGQGAGGRFTLPPDADP